MSGDSNHKRVIFIRHAQSDENVAMQSFFDSMNGMRQARMPSIKDIRKSLGLLSCNPNARLSTLGQRQIMDMGMTLRDNNFWAQFKPDCIIHSPLIRAALTCHGLLQMGRESRSSETINALEHMEVLERNDLVEASPFEHIYSRTLDERIKSFNSFLSFTHHKKIIIVGHRQYFRRLLNQKLPFRNCDVWEVDLHVDQGKQQWSSNRLLYRSILADPHPLDHEAPAEDESQRDRGGKTSSSHINLSANATQSHDDGGVDNDLYDSEPACRICHMSQSEIPHMKMIKPCLCSGSLTFVHIKCLNEWRSTSTTAHFSCTVCRYQYRVQRSALAELIMSEQGAKVVTVALVLVTVLTLGTVLYTLCSLLAFDAIDMICSYANYTPWWRYCDADLQTKILSQFSWPHDFATLRDFFHRLWLLCSSPAFNFLIVCNSFSGAAIEAAVLGLTAVGAAGFGYKIYGEVAQALLDGQQGRRHIFTLGIFLCGMSSQAMGRFGVVIGCAMSVHGLHNFVVVSGRRIAQAIGEQILEVPSAR